VAPSAARRSGDARIGRVCVADTGRWLQVDDTGGDGATDGSTLGSFKVAEASPAPGGLAGGRLAPARG
jgi:hypothetical protein